MWAGLDLGMGRGSFRSGNESTVHYIISLPLDVIFGGHIIPGAYERLLLHDMQESGCPRCDGLQVKVYIQNLMATFLLYI